VLLFSLITVRGYDSREILDDITDAAEAGSGPATLYRAALQAQRADAGLADLDQLDAMIDPTIQRRLDRAGRTG